MSHNPMHIVTDPNNPQGLSQFALKIKYLDVFIARNMNCSDCNGKSLRVTLPFHSRGSATLPSTLRTYVHVNPLCVERQMKYLASKRDTSGGLMCSYYMYFYQNPKSKNNPVVYVFNARDKSQAFGVFPMSYLGFTTTEPIAEVLL